MNNLLQGKGSEALSDIGRVVINSTVGLLGTFDIASEAGLEKHNEDFGQTFGRWGVGSGAYVVIPVFGPRTARDTAGLILDVVADPVTHVTPNAERNVLLVLRAVNDRANLLPADKVVEEAALDKYSYIRDAYLQRRRNLIYDGNAPREPEADAEQVERPVVAAAGAADPQASADSTAPSDPVLVARTETAEAK